MSATRIDYSVLEGAKKAPRPPRSNKRQSGPDAKPRRQGRVWTLPFRLVGAALAAAFVAALALFLLIRGGVFAYQEWGLGTWPSLLLAAGATAILLALSAWVASRRIGAGKGLKKFIVRTAAAAGMGYVAYALVFVAGSNVKSAEVRAEYTSLHPLLRVATSAAVLVDPSSVITDASRTVDDYIQMGLRPYQASLHFRQADGFVHALDFRTIGRSDFRNEVLGLAFSVLGFETLRHTGTADHLHVALRVPD